MSIHSDVGLRPGVGSFPVLVAYVAQTGRLASARWSPRPGLSRSVGRAAPTEHAGTADPSPEHRVEGQITLANGDVLPIDERTLLGPLERALHAMSWAVVLLAAALAVPASADGHSPDSSRRRKPATVVSTTRS